MTYYAWYFRDTLLSKQYHNILYGTVLFSGALFAIKMVSYRKFDSNLKLMNVIQLMSASEKLADLDIPSEKEAHKEKTK